MGAIPKHITVTLNKKKGWWHATSQDLKGLLVASPSFTEFSKEIPLVIAAMLKVKYGVEVSVVEATSPDSDDFNHVVFMAARAA